MVSYPNFQGSLVDSYRKIIEQDQQNDDAEIRIDSDVQII